jgi:hypothetical protein
MPVVTTSPSQTGSVRRLCNARTGCNQGTGLRAACRTEWVMQDVIMLALGLGFFALSVGYAMACERL